MNMLHVFKRIYLTSNSTDSTAFSALGHIHVLIVYHTESQWILFKIFAQ